MNPAVMSTMGLDPLVAALSGAPVRLLAGSTITARSIDLQLEMEGTTGVPMISPAPGFTGTIRPRQPAPL